MQSDEQDDPAARDDADRPLPPAGDQVPDDGAHPTTEAPDDEARLVPDASDDEGPAQPAATEGPDERSGVHEDSGDDASGGVGGPDVDGAPVVDEDLVVEADLDAEVDRDRAAEDAVADTLDRPPGAPGVVDVDDPQPPVIPPTGTRRLADPTADAIDAAPTVPVPGADESGTTGGDPAADPTDVAGPSDDGAGPATGSTDPADTDEDSSAPAATGFGATVQRLRARTLRWWTRSGARGARRWGVTLVVATLVLVVGLLIADRWALVRARGEVYDALTEITDEMDGGEVEIEGFPFLSQVIGGRIDRVDFAADRIVLGDLELRDVTGRAEGVGIRSPRELDRLDASATVPLATIQEQVATASFDVPILGPRSFTADIDGDDLVLETEILTGTVLVNAEVAPTDDGRGVHIHLGRGTVAGVSTELSEIPIVGSRIPVDHYVDLQNLPPNVRITEARIQSDGIRVTIEGQDVPLEAQTPTDPESPSGDGGETPSEGDTPVTGLGQDRGGTDDEGRSGTGPDDGATPEPPGSEDEESDPPSAGDKSTGQGDRDSGENEPDENEPDENEPDVEENDGGGWGIDLDR